MAAALGVGIIGASLSGGWGWRAHVPAILNSDPVRLAALATSRPETAAASAVAVGAGAGYSSAAEMLADPAVDLATVVVRVTEHRVALEEVFLQRKSVYCEWPLGVTTQEAEELTEQAAAAGIETFIGLQARLQPAVVELKRLMLDGALGDIVAISACSTGMGHGAMSLPESKAWVLDEANGLSALTVRTAHTFDAVQFVAGPVAVETSIIDVHRGQTRIEPGGDTVRKTSPDRVLVTGRTSSGAPVTLTTLLGVQGIGQPLLTVYGTAATAAVVPEEFDGQVQMATLRLLVTAGGKRTEIMIPMEGGVQTLSAEARSVRRMYAAIAGKTPGLPTFHDAVELHRKLDDIRAAAVR